MERNDKEKIVKELLAEFTGAQVALVVNYRGLKVSEITLLRKNLRNSGAKARVVKNTLAKIAAKTAFGSGDVAGGTPQEVDRLLKIMEGPSLFITSGTDPVAPAKVIADFMKDKNKLEVRGAWLDGKFLDEAGAKELAKMPGKAETLSKLLALLNTPAQMLMRLVNTPATQVTRVIDAQREKLEKAA